MNMSSFWENSVVQTAGYYSVTVLCIVLFLFIFEIVTKYDNWEEIKNGNLAVAMATGGKIFGIANVFRHSILHHDGLFIMIGWGVYGFFLLLTGYFMFEFLTPKFNVDKEIEKDNRAVGFLSMIISVGLSYVIGSGIN
ncbi:integral inner membrane protein [Lederbergia lenta]|uniref:Integral inner membrane protein n=2 Tax=Lederbergia lenta TaxID=1467 RepID=A0A2X4WC61_LEDLE|nr:integral inner membrane protein [Lederbergia lenta]